MNEIQENIKEKRKAIIVVTLLISLLCVGFSTFIILHGQKEMNEKIKIHENDIRALIRTIEKANTTQYRKRIKSFINVKSASSKEEIVQAFARRDRQELLRLSQPFFEVFKKENKYFSSMGWVLSDNYLLLVHNKPEVFGVDVSGVRPDIAKANKVFKQQYGYLSSCSGFEYRIVQPVNYEGKHLGVVQFGLNIYFVLDTVKEELAIPVVQVMDRKKFEVIKFSSPLHQNSGPYTAQSRDLALIQSAATDIDWSLVRQKIVLAGKDYIISRIFELPNYAGETEGWICALFDISGHTATIRTNIIGVVIASSLLILFSFFFISKSYGRLIDKITELNRNLAKDKTELEDRVMERTLDLHNEQKKLFVTLRSIGDGVITTDTEGRVTFTNIIAEKLTGWNQGEASGQPLSEVFNIINEKTSLTCENPVNKVLASGKIIGLANHTALIARDGTRRSIADSAAPILDPEEKIIGVVLVFRDVTQEKKTEEGLLKIRKLESVGVLAGGIAHDFNNILAAILGNINLADVYIEKGNKAHTLLKEAEKASLRAKDLTQQLLTFSKGGDPVRETASITQIITDSADFVLHGSNVICRYAIPEDLWLVDIDTGQMSQVIQNLVINARHAMPEGGEIKISCENIADITTETGLSLPGEKYLKITIADTGGGIPEKYLDKIFDPYFSTKQEGSGLGLAVTHSIINKHDGHIFVRSKSGKGTTFTIYLPASAEQISSDAGEEAQKPEKAVKGTILVMDDEPFIQNIAKEMLSLFGHDVLQAKDGREAIAIFKEHHHSDNPVDVIIMDLTIPGGMGGKDAIKEILQIDPDARAIVSSGYSNDPVMANYRQHGFKASIGKPFEMAQLKEIINSVLG